MFIDSHTHLDFKQFAVDRHEVINQAISVGVGGFIVPSVSPGNLDAVLALSTQYDNIFPALGFHPWFLQDVCPEDMTLLRQGLKQNPSVIAVGECGLDFALDNKDVQHDVFIAQVKLAIEFDKPLIIHHRKSHDAILKQLRLYQPPAGGVIHAFSGSQQQAEQYLALGFKLGVGGTITYERARKTRDVIARVPLSALLLETDSPDMPLCGRQGQRNSPVCIPEIFNCLCEIRAESADMIKKEVFKTTQTLFRLPDVN